MSLNNTCRYSCASCMCRSLTPEPSAPFNKGKNAIRPVAALSRRRSALQIQVIPTHVPESPPRTGLIDDTGDDEPSSDGKGPIAGPSHQPNVGRRSSSSPASNIGQEDTERRQLLAHALTRSLRSSSSLSDLSEDELGEPEAYEPDMQSSAVLSASSSIDVSTSRPRLPTTTHFDHRRRNTWCGSLVRRPQTDSFSIISKQSRQCQLPALQTYRVVGMLKNTTSSSTDTAAKISYGSYLGEMVVNCAGNRSSAGIRVLMDGV